MEMEMEMEIPETRMHCVVPSTELRVTES
jgi:hypothetical protein